MFIIIYYNLMMCVKFPKHSHCEKSVMVMKFWNPFLRYITSPVKTDNDFDNHHVLPYFETLHHLEPEKKHLTDEQTREWLYKSFAVFIFRGTGLSEGEKNKI